MQSIPASLATRACLLPQLSINSRLVCTLACSWFAALAATPQKHGEFGLRLVCNWFALHGQVTDASKQTKLRWGANIGPLAVFFVFPRRGEFSLTGRERRDHLTIAPVMSCTARAAQNSAGKTQ
jgi:hypothetical protein